jgi:hypothetical protein
VAHEWRSIELGDLYNPDEINIHSPKYMGADPGFVTSKFGVVLNEYVPDDMVLRVVFADHFTKKHSGYMIDKMLELRRDFRNVKNIMIDASQAEFIIDFKRIFESNKDEYPYDYQSKILEWKLVNHKEPWQMGMYVIPVAFGGGNQRSGIGTKSSAMTYRLKQMMAEGYYHINKKFNDLIIAFESAVSKSGDENEIDKHHTSNNDILDAQKVIMKRVRLY